MSYNYAQYVANLANLLVVPPTDPDFLNVLPNIIDDSEQRIYRELDILNTQIVDNTGLLTANSRTFTLPQSIGRFVITNNLNVFAPGRIQLVPTTRDFIDNVYPSEVALTTPSIPKYYAMISDQTVIVGPAPDQGYQTEVRGTIRPTPLSATNTTTYLTLYLPDLFLAGSMVFGAAYQLNFSDISDDPQQSGSWEAHYQKLLPSANTEEQRKRYASQAWTSMQPAPLATPSRA